MQLANLRPTEMATSVVENAAKSRTRKYATQLLSVVKQGIVIRPVRLCDLQLVTQDNRVDGSPIAIVTLGEPPFSVISKDFADLPVLPILLCY